MELPTNLYYKIEDTYGQNGVEAVELAIKWLNNKRNYAEAFELLQPLMRNFDNISHDMSVSHFIYDPNSMSPAMRFPGHENHLLRREPNGVIICETCEQSA